MMKSKFLLITSFLFLTPIGVSHAAGLLDLNNAANLLTNIKSLVNGVIPILVSLALVFFIYALLKFILVAGEKKEDARQQMIYGIIILAVIVGVWGLVNALLGVFGISPGGSPGAVPTVGIIYTSIIS